MSEFVACSEENVLSILDTNLNEYLHPIKTKGVIRMHQFIDEDTLIVSTTDEIILISIFGKVLKKVSVQSLPFFPWIPVPSLSYLWNSNNGRTYVGHSNGHISVYDTYNLECIHNEKWHNIGKDEVFLVRTGRRIPNHVYTGSKDGYFSVSDFGRGVRKLLDSHLLGGSVMCMEENEEMKVLTIGGWDGYCTILTAEDKPKLLYTIKDVQYCYSLLSMDTKIIIGGYKKLNCYDIRKLGNKPIWKKKINRDVTSLGRIEDTLFVSSENENNRTALTTRGRFRIWDIRNGEVKKKLEMRVPKERKFDRKHSKKKHYLSHNPFVSSSQVSRHFGLGTRIEKNDEEERMKSVLDHPDCEVHFGVESSSKVCLRLWRSLLGLKDEVIEVFHSDFEPFFSEEMEERTVLSIVLRKIHFVMGEDSGVSNRTQKLFQVGNLDLSNFMSYFLLYRSLGSVRSEFYLLKWLEFRMCGLTSRDQVLLLNLFKQTLQILEKNNNNSKNMKISHLLEKEEGITFVDPINYVLFRGFRNSLSESEFFEKFGSSFTDLVLKHTSHNHNDQIDNDLRSEFVVAYIDRFGSISHVRTVFWKVPKDVHSNVVLRCENREIKTNFQILLLRSNFFSRMMRFAGSEKESFETSSTIPVEVLSFKQTVLFVQFLESGKFEFFEGENIEKGRRVNIDDVLTLMEFCDMHQENEFLQYLISAFDKFYTKEDVISSSESVNGVIIKVLKIPNLEKLLKPTLIGTMKFSKTKLRRVVRNEKKEFDEY